MSDLDLGQNLRPPPSLDRMIDCVRREVGMRHKVYKRKVERGGMTQHAADEEIRCMDAVLRTLLNLRDGEGR